MPIDDDSAVACRECGRPLTHDQRYCTRCGARRLALPTRIAVALAELAERHRTTGPAQAAPATAPDPDASEPPRNLIGVARAAAVSILLMLGFGSVIGAATTPGGVTSLASTIVVAVSPALSAPVQTIASATPPAATGAGGGSGGRSGGGGHSGGGGGASQRRPAQTTQTASPAPTPTTSTSATTSSPLPTTPSLPPIHHVWEIVLSDQGYDQSFGTITGHPYLSRTLARQGTVIADYDAVAGSSLANEAALISGQGPTPQTLQNCPQYSAITPGVTGRHGQIRGTGCVYPSGTQTLGSELAVDGDRWRAFIQGVGTAGQRSTAPTTTTTTTTTGTGTTPTPGTTTASPPATTTTTSAPQPQAATTTAATTTTTTSTSSTATLTDTSHAAGCPHPAQDAADPGQVSGADDYVTWKNPWVYFDSVLDSTTCAHDDVGLGALRASLRRVASTPSFSYIAPDPCDDGSDTPCAPGAAAGLGQADQFLHTVVPEIERSAAYRAGGLILITFDQSPQSGTDWSTASCCGQPAYPNLKGLSTASTGTSTTPTTSTTTTPGTTTTTTSTTTTAAGPTTTGTPPGGGQVGLLMISPYVPAGKLDEIHIYNHFSLLKTLAQLFGVTPPGYADLPTVTSLSPTLFTQTRR